MKKTIVFLCFVFACVSVAHADEKPLHSAAKEGDVEKVKSLIEQGAEVNLQDEYGQTPLHLAIRFGKFEVAKYLTRRGSDVNASDNTGRNPLMCAVEAGSRQMIIRPFSSVASYGGLTPYEGQFEMVKFLVDNGANVNSTTDSGHTPLFLAVFHGQSETVELLLEKGANPNTTIKSKKPIEGQTALMVAAGRGDTDIVKLLLKKKAYVNAKDGAGYTAWLYAMNEEIEKILENAGARITQIAPTSTALKGVEVRILFVERRSGDANRIAYKLKALGAEVNLRSTKYSGSEKRVGHMYFDAGYKPQARLIVETVKDIEPLKALLSDSPGKPEIAVWVLK